MPRKRKKLRSGKCDILPNPPGRGFWNVIYKGKKYTRKLYETKRGKHVLIDGKKVHCRTNLTKKQLRALDKYI